MDFVGAGGSITGKGADLLIIDDPIKNSAEAASLNLRDKLWDWFNSTAMTRLEPGGIVIVVMTRWHEDDLCGRIIANNHIITPDEYFNNQSSLPDDFWVLAQIPAIVAALMLFGALGQWPYGYYQLLRLVVCGVSIYIAIMAYQLQKIWAVWLFGFIGLLFNPLIPIHLPREVWQLIDVTCAFLFIAIISFLRNPYCRKKNYHV